ncbi:MAG TPA: hypothetical protein DDZ89_17095 [Clostridiales bacterium]|nr:hypothetical protein [Clostridiales bacterium]
MILPTKHTNFSESLLGFGSYILNKLEKEKTIDSLWHEYQNAFQRKEYPAKHSFENLLLTLVFLYSIGAIEEQDGGVMKCT